MVKRAFLDLGGRPLSWAGLRPGQCEGNIQGTHESRPFQQNINVESGRAFPHGL